MKHLLLRHFFIIGFICFVSLLLNISKSFAQKNQKGIYFSHASGFYDAPFDLSISIDSTESELYYTIDGSNPATSTTRFHTGISGIINVNPEIGSIRPVTPAFFGKSDSYDW